MQRAPAHVNQHWSELRGKIWVWPALVTHVGTAVCVRGICLDRFCASAALQVFFCGGKELLVPQLFCLRIQARLGVNIGVSYVPRADSLPDPFPLQQGEAFGFD